MTTIPIKLNLGAGHKKLKGFINLDKDYGWKFQDGLGDYLTNTVEAITISHALMFLTAEELDKFLDEAYRVLKQEGVIRITEDNTENPDSDTYKKGWRGCKCLTSPEMMSKHLAVAGFAVSHCTPERTNYKDKSLIQTFHNENNPERVFHIEGLKFTY